MPGTASPAPRVRLELVALTDFSQHTMPGVRRQVREAMRKIKSIVSCWLLLLSLCLTDSAGQRRMHYPKNAGDIIAFVEVFSQLDFSVKDAIKRLGTVYSAKPDDFHIVLTPFPSERDEIEGVTLAIF